MEINKTLKPPRRRKYDIRYKANTKIQDIKKKNIRLQTKKIPLEKLLKAKEIINNPEHPAWYNRNTSCMPGIHCYKETIASSQSDLMIKLFYAKQCLLRRDWKNFTKIIALCNPSGLRRHNDLFPLVSKYAAICLAYLDPSKLDMLLQTLLNSAQYDANALIAQCSKYTEQDSFYLKQI